MVIAKLVVEEGSFFHTNGGTNASLSQVYNFGKLPLFENAGLVKSNPSNAGFTSFGIRSLTSFFIFFSL